MNLITIQPKQCRLLEFEPGNPLPGHCIGIEITASRNVQVFVFDEENASLFTIPETRSSAKPILSWIGPRCNLVLDGLPPVFFVGILSLDRKLPTDISYFIGVARLQTSYVPGLSR